MKSTLQANVYIKLWWLVFPKGCVREGTLPTNIAGAWEAFFQLKDEAAVSEVQKSSHFPYIIHNTTTLFLK